MLIEITYNVTDVFMSTTETPVYVEISFEQPGGSAAVWGSITGTLSNQTDLQNALNLKVPYTGATTNVNLGEYELKAGQVTLDTSPTGTAAVGTIRWNDTTGTSETTLKGGNVIIKNGVDLVARVVNKVTPNTTLTKAAYQAVRVSGAQGQRLAIELAQANNDAGSADTIGLVTETIATNQEGFIMTVGQLEGINTTGSLQGETWVDGDVLYLSPTTAGALTNIKPTAVTGHIVVIGYVEYAHVNNGKIYVKVMNGWELDELHNVSIVSPANNQGLFYNATSTLWENKSITTALGYTPVPTTRNITINGVTYDLSADRTWTISAGISGSGAAGQVTYWTGASAVSGSALFLWDNSVGLLTVKSENSASPVRGIMNEQYNNGVQAAAMVFRKARGTISSPANVLASDLVGAFSFSARVGGVFTSDRALFGANMATTTGIGLYFTAGSSDGSYTPALYIHPTSNVVVNGGGSIITGGVTDGGQRFQVYGDTLLRGSGSTNTTTGLTVQNSSSTNLLRVLNNGDVSFGADAMFWDAANGRLGIGTNVPASELEIIGNKNGTVLLGVSNTNSGTIARTVFGIGQSVNTSPYNALYIYHFGSGYNPINNQLPSSVSFSAGPAVINGMTFVIDNTSATGHIRFITNISSEKLRIYGNGNVLIQNGGTFTDLGYRLGVVGDTLLRGSGNTSATTALTVQNSDNRIIIRATNNGVLQIGNINANSIYPFSSSVGTPDIQGTSLAISTNLSTSGNGIAIRNAQVTNRDYTSGDGSFVRLYEGYAPTSGTGTWQQLILAPQINQTGGANGITRGLYVAPTLTSAADFRAIEVSAGVTVLAPSVTARASLRIPSGTAPTSPNDGDIWFDGTDIKMRIGGVTKTFTLI